jgi:hypothetical protein
MDATISRLLPVVIDSFMKSYTVRSNDGEGSSSASSEGYFPDGSDDGHIKEYF